MFKQLLSRVLEATGANAANAADGADAGFPEDFYKVLIGLSLVAKGKGSPLYDPVALLATLHAISAAGTELLETAGTESAGTETAGTEGPRSLRPLRALRALRPVTVAEAQSMLDSCPEGIPEPAVNAALVISTDVSLNSTDGTSDTDDRIMLLLLCFFLAKRCSANGAVGVHSVTIVLSARKKGPKDAKDETTPDQVVQWMRERAAQFGGVCVDGDGDGAALSVNGVDVRVFQQQAQTTPSALASVGADSLESVGAADPTVESFESVALAELRAANAALYERLGRLGRLGRLSAPLYFVGCGPIDVALASYLAERASGYTISFDGGVNAGEEADLDARRHSHRGGPVLLASAALAMVNIGPSITRGLVTPPGIVALDDAGGVMAVAKTAFKVAGSPLVTGNLAFRIFVSNCTSFLGAPFVAELVERANAGTDTCAFPYSRSLALTMVANLMAAHGAPIDHSVLSLVIASGTHAKALSCPLPSGLARAIDANVKGIETVAALYAFIALGMDARLSAIMAEWDSITRVHDHTDPAGLTGTTDATGLTDTTDTTDPAGLTGLTGLKDVKPPVVSYAVPVFSDTGLLLSQPF